MPCLRTVTLSKQGNPEGFQNRYLEQKEDCSCDRNGRIGGQRLVPHPRQVLAGQLEWLVDVV